jgi:hypothetical protein
MRAKFLLAENGMRWRRKNTATRRQRRRCGHTMAAQVPVRWSLYFSWIPLNIHTQLSICILNYDLRRIFVA